MEIIDSYATLIERIARNNRSFLLLYKEGSDLSRCAFTSLSEVAREAHEGLGIFAANVSEVRDIHERYGITTVPSLLIFEKKDYINVIKGCQDTGYYKALAEQAIYQAKIRESGKTQKSVKVYSTPTCSWCNSLKAYLRKQGIAFTDIDVSRDEQAVQELIRRSGQTGVPQTEIDGQIIVGFDKTKINNALGING